MDANDTPPLLGPSCVVVSPASDAPPARLVCRPEARTLVGYTRRILHLRGHGFLAVFSYSATDTANWLFLISIHDGSAERHEVPNGEKGSHAAALGLDGHIYTVTPAGRIHRFEVGPRRWTTLRHRIPEGQLPWDAFGAPNGRIYFGTYPDTVFGEYDPATDRLIIRERLDPHAKYLIDFRPLPDGRIQFIGVGESKQVHTYDPATGAFTCRPSDDSANAFQRLAADLDELARPEVAPPAPDQKIATKTLGGRRVGIATPSGRLCEINAAGEATPRWQGPVGPDVWKLIATDERTLCGVGMTGEFFRLDLDSGEVATHQLPNLSPDGNNYYYLEAPSPRWVVGGHYSQQNAFRADVETGWWETSPTMIARVPGEPTASVSVGGKVYLGIYINALMLVHDPDRPFAYGVNPRELLQVGHAQGRPRGMATDGRRVFMSSWRDFCSIGGALTVLDTKDDSWRVFADPLPGHNLDALAFDCGTGHLFGGTFRWGDSDSFPPVHPAAVVYEFDPDSGKVVHRVAPWPDADLIRVMGVLPEGVVVARRGWENDLALLDRRDLRTLHRGPFPDGTLVDLQILPDGRVYGLSDSGLFRWDVRSNALRFLAACKGMQFLRIPAPGRFILGSQTAIHRVDLPAEA